MSWFVFASLSAGTARYSLDEVLAQLCIVLLELGCSLEYIVMLQYGRVQLQCWYRSNTVLISHWVKSPCFGFIWFRVTTVSLQYTKTITLAKQGQIRHKPCPIQTVADSKDSFRLSRKLQTVKTVEDCQDNLKGGAKARAWLSGKDHSKK